MSGMPYLIRPSALPNFFEYANKIEAIFKPVHAKVKLWMVAFFQLELHCATLLTINGGETLLLLQCPTVRCHTLVICP